MDTQKEAAEKLNQLLSFLHSNTRLQYFTLSRLAEALFELNDNKEINISGLDYEGIQIKQP